MFDALAEWNVAPDNARKLLAQVVPYPFAQMMIGGCWSSTLVLARFPLLRSLFPSHDNCPPQAWLERAQPVHRLPSAAPLVASRFRDIASELKKRAIQAPGHPGDDKKVAGMVEYLQDVAATLECTAVEGPRTEAMRNIRQALLSFHFKNMKAVKIIASRAWSTFFPESDDLVGGGEDRLSQRVREDHFKLDIALMLTQRDINFSECFVRMALADSSPQGAFDFLMWKEIMVPVKDLMRVSEAICFLQTSRGGVLYDADDSDDIPMSMLRRRTAANQVLSECIVVHTYAPGTMGQGSTGSEDKVACGCHQMATETWDVPHLFRHLTEYHAYTSDMGTEIKIPDFRLQRSAMNLHLPSWLANRRHRAPMREESDDNGGYSNPFVQCDTEDFLPNALPLPGANHLIHNIVKGLREPMEHYAAFLLQLKVLEMVLCHPGRKERLIAKCVLGTPYGSLAHTIRRFSFTLHEPRWHSIVAFCKAVVGPLGILRRCWREADYKENGKHDLEERAWGDGDQKGNKFNPSESSAILRSALFRFYLHMIIILQSIPTKVAQWFDSCSCHELLMIGKTAWYRRRALKEDGLPSGVCPCMSCRGWEVVDGRLEGIIRDLGNLAKHALEALVGERCDDGFTDRLKDSDMNAVMRDLMGGISYLMAGFAVKLAFLKNLPYILMGLCCPRRDRRQHWAKVSLAAYKAKPEDQHHRKSVAFMQEATPLRRDMEALAEHGTTTPLLETMIAPFLLMPFGDRLIEMEHKPLSDIARAAPHIKSGDRWAVQRMTRIEKSLQDPVWKDKFVSHFMSLSSLRSIIFAMGFENHPAFHDFLFAAVPLDERKQNSYRTLMGTLKETATHTHNNNDKHM